MRNKYYIVYKKKILHGPMSKEDAIKKLFELSVTFKGLRVRSYFGKNKEEKLEEIPPSPPEDQDPES
ncbi:hypothetical protein G9U52_19500 [Paenibacillus sp. S3N08]|uniref:Uncharacterized protein n=1 Tax=Paenibacillus agricola TaxID=2716264 RepID=A0ABX0J9P9_9BACL|nr:hypothetical protein [Paenibacillus agricola]